MITTKTKNTPPLASFRFIKYLGVTFIIASLLVVIQFYYYYADDLFSKSLTLSNHIQVSYYAVTANLSLIIFPTFFFSGGLVYFIVRKKGMNPLHSLLKDMLVILPLGIILWFYGTRVEEHLKYKFYAMVFDIQNLEPGENLVVDIEEYKMFKAEDVSEKQNRIKEIEKDINVVLNHDVPGHSDARMSYVKELRNQQEQLRNEIMSTHLSPVYVLLVLILGMQLGYLIPFNKMALVALLIVLGIAMYFLISIIDSVFTYGISISTFDSLIYKIGLLSIFNILLFVLTIRNFNRSNKNQLKF